jgi:hypothetical protein
MTFPLSSEVSARFFLIFSENLSAYDEFEESVITTPNRFLVKKVKLSVLT